MIIAKQYITPSIREVGCETGDSVMATSPLIGVTHQDFDEEEMEWDNIEGYYEDEY